MKTRQLSVAIIIMAILLSTICISGLAGEARAPFAGLSSAPVAYNHCRQNCNGSRQRSAYRERGRSRMGSKTRTALTIAAPAALGMGIGALADGKKGALGGALIGGSAGALYRLFRTR
ncbi:MAG: hypothetical protein ACKV2V_29280 [Blastocatellia bacterium]